MRRFFIEKPDSESGNISIVGTDANHIKNVLRMRTGDKISIVDGRGNEHLATIEKLTSGCVDVAVDARIISNRESPVEIIIAQAYLKHKKMDFIVRQITELGVSQWTPFFAARSVPRPDDKQLAKRTARWEMISREALKQCRRNRLMKIRHPVPFKDILKSECDCDLKIIFCTNETGHLATLLKNHNRPSTLRIIMALIGPEGGFTTQEIENAKAGGFIPASLGPRILRAETATVAACTLLQHYFGDIC
ncbi:16S rRNA (uracil(1498)-N(3))-methyltransferase [Desulfococcaceae bacterium HSG9]|nr:16S rRNA (uracil(1498)-N(3))-methyltransferase [Desulfococcaceae bacterium HSG9]